MNTTNTNYDIPDESWLNGKYPFGEINTRLPYVAVNENYIEGGYFAQGEDASRDIKTIHQIWVQDDLTATEAFRKFINLYL